MIVATVDKELEELIFGVSSTVSYEKCLEVSVDAIYLIHSTHTMENKLHQMCGCGSSRHKTI